MTLITFNTDSYIILQYWQPAVKRCWSYIMINYISFLIVATIAGITVAQSSRQLLRDSLNCTAGTKFDIDGIKYECFQSSRTRGYRPIGVIRQSNNRSLKKRMTNIFSACVDGSTVTEPGKEWNGENFRYRCLRDDEFTIAWEIIACLTPTKVLLQINETITEEKYMYSCVKSNDGQVKLTYRSSMYIGIFVLLWKEKIPSIRVSWLQGEHAPLMVKIMKSVNRGGKAISCCYVSEMATAIYIELMVSKQLTIYLKLLVTGTFLACKLPDGSTIKVDEKKTVNGKSYKCVRNSKNELASGLEELIGNINYCCSKQTKLIWL